DVVLLEGLHVEVRQRVAQCLLAGHARADARLEETTGGPAGTEPRDADLAGDLAEGGVESPVELLLVDLDRQLDLVAFAGLDAGLHTGSAVYRRPPATPAVLGRYGAAEMASTRSPTLSSGRLVAMSAWV